MGNSNVKVDEERKHPKTPDRWYEELTGACYYKSGWVEMEVNTGGFGPFGKKKMNLWLQHIRWVDYVYPGWQYWYNWGSSEPPKEDDMSGIDLPKIPGLPSLPGMPKLDMPDISMPDVSMPDVSMPDISAPKVDLSAPKLSGVKGPKKKERPENGPWMRFEIRDAKVKRGGDDITISGINDLSQYWKDKTENPKGPHTIKFEASSKEQAESWEETFISGGAEKA